MNHRFDTAPARDRSPLGAVVTTMAMVAAAACTSTVVPPAPPADPVTVFVLSEAMHTGVVLPPVATDTRDADRYVEFGFGDWSYYALGNDAWYDACGAALWPTQGALARRVFRSRDPGALVREARWAQLAAIEVEREQVVRLRAALEARFDAGRDRLLPRADLRFDFVPAAASYWFPHTCADAAAEWLGSLGCEVWWAPVRAGLAVGPVPDAGS